MDSLTGLFCLLDDFCQTFEPEWERHLLAEGQKRRRRAAWLRLSELITLAVLFYQLRYRHFKTFYLSYAVRFLRAEFPELQSYHRCLELMPRWVPLSALFAQPKGPFTGIIIVDSSPLAVCDNLRISRYRVLAKVAARGKSPTGWFHGFKLHVAINYKGELLNIKVTPGNIDDRKPVAFLWGVFGRVLPTKATSAAGWWTCYARVRWSRSLESAKT